MENTKLKKAIEIANNVLRDMTREELIQYAFDRYVDELLRLNPTALENRYKICNKKAG